MNKVMKSVNKFIIPFVYKGKYNNVCDEILLSEHTLEVESVFPESISIHTHLQNHYNGENSRFKRFDILPDTLIESYQEVTKRRRSHIEVAGNTKDGVKQTFKFRLNEISFYIFDSSLGYLVIDIENMSKDILEYVNTSYFIKSIKRDSVRTLEWVLKKGKDETDVKIVDLINVFNQCFSLIEVENFMNNGPYMQLDNPDVNYPAEMLIFSLLILENKSDIELGNKSNYWLSRGYKDSYKVDSNAVSENTIQKFQNLNWNISTEGVSAVSYLDDKDEQTNAFLNQNIIYDSPFTNVYFTLYLLALNQRYTYLNTIKKITINLNESVYSDNIKELRKQYKKSMIEISKISITNTFLDISNNSLYQNFFDASLNQLRVNEIRNELEMKVKGLDTIAEILTQEENESKDKLIKRISVLGQLFILIAGADTLGSITIKIMTENDFNTDIPFSTIYAASLGILVVSYFVVLKIIKSKLKAKRGMDE